MKTTPRRRILVALTAMVLASAGTLASSPKGLLFAETAATSTGAVAIDAPARTSPYQAELEKWRADRETRLKADGGWLTVAGLFWLKEGVNRFGTDPTVEIVLPAGSAPPRAGAFQFKDGTTTVSIEPGVTVTAGGKPVTTMEVRPDSTDEPDVLSLGALTMIVIKRGERFGVRLKDMNSPARKAFSGLTWFPIDPAYCVTARFVPYDPPREIPIPTVLGTTETMKSPGAVVFTLNGQELRLDPVLEDPDATDLFFIFRDRTSGKETYPPGRFLYTDLPKDGTVVLDFNRAYNPPCAFTPYATCPLPPPQNRLSARIEAGERSYGQH